jgi:hypothetical protein
MSKVDDIINYIETVEVDDLLELETFDECFEMLRDMEAAMLTFIHRVDIGEIHSTKTYNSFKRILEIDLES